MKKDKPETIPFFKFWLPAILGIFQSIGNSGSEFVIYLYRKITGRWYCDHCQKYHGIRVKSHKIIIYRKGGTISTVCSLGKVTQVSIEKFDNPLANLNKSSQYTALCLSNWRESLTKLRERQMNHIKE